MKRYVVMAALVSAAVVTWGSVREGHAPYPYQFVGTGMAFTVLLLMAEAAPEVAVPLALLVTFGLAVQTANRKSPAAPPSGAGLEEVVD